jgi:hypothetical protein
MPRYTFKCPVCDKELASNYKDQLEFNALNHLYMHLRKGEVESVDINEIRKSIVKVE